MVECDLHSAIAEVLARLTAPADLAAVMSRSGLPLLVRCCALGPRRLPELHLTGLLRDVLHSGLLLLELF